MQVRASESQKATRGFIVFKRQEQAAKLKKVKWAQKVRWDKKTWSRALLAAQTHSDSFIPAYEALN